MNDVALYNRYNTLINTVLRWKVIPLPCLKEVIKYSNSAHAFRQTIRKLEKGRLLKSSSYGAGREKILHPSSELITREAPHLSASINDANLQHDALVTKIALALLKYPQFVNVELPHEYRKKKYGHESIYSDLGPDAVLWGKENGETFFIALEVELWRKDRERVYEKLLKYAKSDFFNFVFYFFLFETSFDSYKKRLQELIDETSMESLNRKIILIHEGRLLEQMTSFANAKVYVNETEKNLKELLGEEKKND